VESAIRQAAAFRSRQGHPLAGDTVHHSDAGSQYTAVRLAKTLMLAVLIPSTGTVGDALDNALAETTIGCTRPNARERALLFGTGRWPP
jgi:putative transposase